MRLFFLIIFCGSLCVGYGQSSGPRLPKDLVLEKAEDYREHEGLAKKCAAWLINTPLDKEVKKRNELNAFVMMWFSGSPDYTLVIQSEALPFLADHEELLFPFIHGMGLYVLGHPQETDAVKLHAEGLKAVSIAVNSSKCVQKDKVLKSILKAERRGKLTELVESWLLAN